MINLDRDQFHPMSDKTVVDLIEEWQSGAFILFGSITCGLVVAVIAGSVVGIGAGFLGFIVGSILGFFVLSYLLYGR